MRQIANSLPAAFAKAARAARRIALALIPGLAVRFRAVARRKTKSKTRRGSGSDSEATSRFFSVNQSPCPQPDEQDKFGSSFLTGLVANQASRAAIRRRLRALFKARQFLRPPWLR